MQRRSGPDRYSGWPLLQGEQQVAALSLKQLARDLNGEIRNGQVLCPGPGHSHTDRSLAVKISDSGDDIVVHSFAGDDAMECKEYAREKCGIEFKPNGNGKDKFSIDVMVRAAKAAAANHKPKAKPVAIYHYTDSDSTLIYDVLRFDNPKRFAHRLADGTFKGSERRVIYRWPDIIKYRDATIFITEGEKDADRLWSIDLCATTVASGKWTEDCVQALAGRHVLILADNDTAGERKALEAATLLHGVADTVRVIRLPGLGAGEDVSDWLDADPRRGTSELADVCFDAPLWEPSSTPEPEPELTSDNEKNEPLPASKSLVAFPLIAFEHVTLNTGRDYLVKDLLPRVGLCLIWGPRKCGKSFWAMDLALHVAFGWEYRGRKVLQAPVIYLALEGHGGYPRRIEAFKQYHGVKVAPFYLLRAKINLTAKADQLCKDIEAQLGNEKPGAIFVDTLNRSLVGSESSDEDMAKYLAAAGKIEERFNCLVVIIHHCGYDESHPRGHTALSAGVDVQIAVRRGNDLEIIATVDLAKDGPEGAEIYSRLHPVDVGFDSEGDPIGSLVVLPAEKSATSHVAARLNDRQRNALDALAIATIDFGVPPTFELPASINRVVKIEEWRKAMFANGTLNQGDANPRADFKRLRNQLKDHHAIGIHGDFVWRS
jgi:hypothetical protein